MLITNNYLRKLIWAVAFALFCLFLAGLYSGLLKKRREMVFECGGKKIEFFSSAELVLFFIMTFMAAIRLNVGSDFFNYFNRFNAVSTQIPFIKIVNSMDGYKILSYLIKLFTDNQYAIFFAIAFISYAYLFHLLKDEVEDRSSALICYLFMGFFANSLNILKQYIAMIFVMCFYRSLCKKQIIRCILFAFFAFLFHYTSIFALAVIFIVKLIKLKPSKSLIVIAIVGSFAVAALLPQIISVLIKIIPSASGYSVYVNWRRNGQFRLVIAVIVMSLVYALLLSFIYKYRWKIKEYNEQRYMEITFLIIGLAINIASVRIWVVQRVALYFYQFIILIIPTLLQSLEPKLRRKVKIIIFSVMFVYLIFAGIFNGENEYYSYNTIFSGDSPIYDADYNKLFN